VTIGHRLRLHQPYVWMKLLVEYDLIYKYLPEFKTNEIIELMKPGAYSGKVERKRGAVVQKHRLVIK
jgi:hypothetical protein